jgi:hypothetical protein
MTRKSTLACKEGENIFSSLLLTHFANCATSLSFSYKVKDSEKNTYVGKPREEATPFSAFFLDTHQERKLNITDSYPLVTRTLTGRRHYENQGYRKMV